ncbi:hypothetical protein KP509_20G001900 [Ceratopteris richardii]|nr:hypothetical protein KP509_20G001900 [Ceratopteris richardii]
MLHAFLISSYMLDVSLENALITLYGKCGSVSDALCTFNHMEVHTVISWNALIAVLISHGVYEEALLYFERMQKGPLQPDNVTCISILSACAKQNLLKEGLGIHTKSIIFGFDTDINLQNAFIHMYGQCGSLEEAFTVFRASSQDDIISWNVMMSACSYNGCPDIAQQLYHQISVKAVIPNRVSYVNILTILSNKKVSEFGRQIHAILASKTNEFEVVLGTAFVNLYGKSGCLGEAGKVFDKMENLNTVSWNAFIASHVQNGQNSRAQQIFCQMLEESYIMNNLTFINVLDSCDDNSSSSGVKRLHVLIKGNNLEKDKVVENALMNMYGKCNCLSIAKDLFDGMHERNELTWNAMITHCAQNGHAMEAFKVFNQMLQESSLADKVTFIGILDACMSVVDLKKGIHTHAMMVRSHVSIDVVLCTSLINMYSKCDKFSAALGIFDKLDERDVIPWSTLISGYAQQGQSEEALYFFNQMCQEGVMPNKITYVSVLAACSIHAVHLAGKRIHVGVSGQEQTADVVLSNALINLYGKCGCLRDAQAIFDSMLGRNLISWSAIIAAYAYYGEDEEVLQLFSQMQESGLKPNDVTFVSVLSALGHSGRVDEGYYWFLSMGTILSIPPSIDHYNSLIDLVGRAGRLDEAENLLAFMPSKVTIVSVMALLSACKYQLDEGRGEHFARNAFVLFPENAQPYIMLSNIYSSSREDSDLESMYEQD